MKQAILFAALFSASAVQAETALEFKLGAGVNTAPSYFGSSENTVSPTLKFRFGSAHVFGRDFGGDAKMGFSPRGSMRVIGARTAADNPELAGLEDIDFAVEFGLGVGYEADRYRLFGDLRQGLGGHTGQVLEFGADVKFDPSPELHVTAGPRVLFGSDDYMSTYFGVTSTEAAASDFSSFETEGGLVSTGAQISAEYSLGGNWSVLGEVQHDIFRGDAADSPITGTDRATAASLSLVRNFALRF